VIGQFHGAAVISPFRSLHEGAMELAFANYGISGQSAVTVSILYGSIQLVADLSGGLLRLTDQ
jgi:hypothetical protein